MDIYNAVGKLNELAVLDPAAMESLVMARVGCNEGIANHPTVEVSKIKETYVVGLLGILNGLFGTGEKVIAVTWDGEPEKMNFTVMERWVASCLK